MKPTAREHVTTHEGAAPLVLRLRPAVELTLDRLLEVSSLSSDRRLELTARGVLVVMPPAGSEAADRNAELTMQMLIWARHDGTGVTFDSSAGFTVPNGAVRSPNASWVERSRWTSLTAGQRQNFAPLCPDFVIELRSPSDSLSVAQAKMHEYLENGARPGWLLDPDQKRVCVYRPGAPTQRLENPEKVSGDTTLPGFDLDLREVW